MSHYSPVSKIPFPHFIWHTFGVDALQVYPVSTAQLVHPSPSIKLPSSQVSPAYNVPSPHFVHYFVIGFAKKPAPQLAATTQVVPDK